MNTTTDLFENPASIPPIVQEVIDAFSQTEQNYTNCEELRQSLQALGYDCEYDLSGEPFNLHKI